LFEVLHRATMTTGLGHAAKGETATGSSLAAFR